MFGLSTWELLVILVVALMFIGPDQLPKVARKLGEGMRQVRGAMTRMDAEVRRTIREATAEDAAQDGAQDAERGGHHEHPHEPTAGHLATPTIAGANQPPAATIAGANQPPAATIAGANPTTAFPPATPSAAFDANRDPLAPEPEPEPRPFVVPPRNPPAGVVGRLPSTPPPTPTAPDATAGSLTQPSATAPEAAPSAPRADAT